MKIRLTFFIVIILISSVFAQQQDAGVSYVFAKKLYDDGLYDLAAEQFHLFAEQNFENPRAPESLLLAGKCYFNNGDFKSTIRELAYLITRYPEAKILDEAQYNLALAFEKDKNLVSAAKAFSQVHFFYPKSKFAGKSLMRSAEIYRELNKHEKSKEIIFRLLEYYPNSEMNLTGRLLLADVYCDESSFKLAINELDKLLGITEKGLINATAMYKRAKLELESGKLESAQEKFTDLNSKYGNYSGDNSEKILKIVRNSYLQTAKISSEKGQYNESNQILAKIADYEGNAEVLSQMGNNYLKLNQFENSADYFSKAVQLIEDTVILAESYYKLGISYSKISRFTDSIESLDKVLLFCEKKNVREKISDLYFNSILEICNSYIKLGLPKVAANYLVKSEEKILKSKQREILKFAICSIYEKEARDYERAIRGYYSFIDNYANSKFIDDAQAGLARSFEKKGDFVKAVEEYTNLIENYPASEYFDHAKKRINYINNYENAASNRSTNFNILLTQLIAGQQDKLSTFDIGLLYFKEIKDYDKAIEYFSSALESMGEQEDKKVDATYYLARAIQLSGEREGITLDQKTRFNKALTNFSYVIDYYPNSQWTDDAAFYKIDLTEKLLNQKEGVSKFDSLKKIMTNFKYLYPNSEYLEKINLKLGKLILANGISGTIDSLDAANCFKAVIDSRPADFLLANARYHLAKLFVATGNDSAAMEILRSSIADKNINYLRADANILLARILITKHDFERAGNILNRVIKQFYYSKYAGDAKLSLAKLLFQQEKYSKAIVIYEELFEELFNDYNTSENKLNQQEEVLYQLAKTKSKIGDREEAIRLYHKYLSLFPLGKYSPHVLFDLGNLFSTNKREDQDKAISFFKQLTTDFENSAFQDSALVSIGNLYFYQKEYEKANNYYNRHIENGLADKDYSNTHAQIIIGLYNSGKIQEGNQKLKQFKKLFKDRKDLIAKIMLEKGNYYLKNKNFDPAEKIFKEARSDFKNTQDGAKAEYLLGRLYFILNKDKEALEIMTKIIEKYPDDIILSDVYLMLGNFYYLQSRQIESAMLAYKKAISVPGISEEKLQFGMNNLIKCYSDLRLREQALMQIKVYLTEFPTAKDIFEKKVLMGVLYYELKEFDRALDHLRKLKMEADLENEPRIQYWIAECYFGKGEFKRAVSEYLKVVYLSKPTKFQWNVTAQYQAGVAYLKAREPEKAKEIFNKIVKKHGATSVFGKPAKQKIDEINRLLISENNDS